MYVDSSAITSGMDALPLPEVESAVVMAVWWSAYCLLITCTSTPGCWACQAGIAASTILSTNGKAATTRRCGCGAGAARLGRQAAAVPVAVRK